MFARHTAALAGNNHVRLLTKVLQEDDFYRNIWWDCLDCGKVFAAPVFDFYGEYPARCPFCNFGKNRRYSSYEYEIVNWIHGRYPNLNVFHRSCENRSVIPAGELDIYIPELKFAIEFDGVFWHSAEFKNQHFGKYENTLLLKTLQCEELGLRLVHIFEDDWISNKDMLKTLISMNIEGRAFEFDDDLICLDRHLFPKTVDISGYDRIGYLKPRINKRGRFHLYDCGRFILRKNLS